MGKASDSRAAASASRHGRLVQVELEALDPATLRELYADAIESFVDESMVARVVAQEEAERATLR